MTINSNLCPTCQYRKQGPYPNGMCRKCYDESRAPEPVRTVPTNLTEQIKVAQKSGDWKSLADSLSDTIQGAADGTIKVTAAQASILKHVMDRAYGKVSKSQEDKTGASGVIVLPTLGSNATANVCMKCKAYHLIHND